MKVTIKILTLWMFVMSSLAMVSCDKTDDPISEVDESSEAVVFADDNLEQVVRFALASEEINLSSTNHITRGELAQLKKLAIRDIAPSQVIVDLAEFTDLKGLEYAKNLSVLDIEGTRVASLEPVKDLENVTYLRLRETLITDLSPVSNYTKLTYFNANRMSGITDISALSKNIGMQTMILRDVQMGNSGLEAIRDFTKLYRLNIRSTGVTDLTIIAELIGKGAFLKTTPGADELGDDPTLDLQGLEITNCALLDPYRESLAGEVTGGCAAPSVPVGPSAITVADAALLAHIRARLELAEGVALDSENILNLTAIEDGSGFPPLASVVNLTGLEYAANLEKVNLHKTKVIDLTPIKDLKKVTYLRVSETPVEDLSPVSEYTTLTYFNSNQASPGLKDISPLAKNVNIQEMILRGNPLGNGVFETVKNFTKLHRLNLRSTGITNVTVLGELMSKGALLKTTEGYVDGDSELDIRGNTISDYTPIQSYIDEGKAVNVSK